MLHKAQPPGVVFDGPGMSAFVLIFNASSGQFFP
jgi:hypothetical protein